jgi:CelD/BcsL family acetyltransferase involved in cellulose biosynthesis
MFVWSLPEKEKHPMKTNRRYDEVAGYSPLHIIELDPQTDPRWETFMNSLSTSVIYQHPGWLGAMEEAYGYKPLHLACEDAAGQVRGILPLFYRRRLRTGRVCFSLSPVAGPLADNEQAYILLLQAAIERSRVERAITFQFTTRSTCLDHLVDHIVGVPLGETYELALPEQPDLLRLDSRIRWAVKKATRLGVRIRQAETISELRAWYDLYLQTTRRLVVMPRPYRVFERAWQRLHPPGLLQLLLAEQVEAGKRRLISGFLFLRWKHTISHLYTGWRREDQDLRPNDLLHWHAIHTASAEGFRWYDFGSVNRGNQSLAQFKTKWGAETRMIYRYSYPVISRGGTNGPLRGPEQDGQATSTLRQFVTPLWQRLPLKVTELAGEWFWAVL